MSNPTPEGLKLAVDVLLAEYKEHKTEIGMRAQRQTQTFNYVLVVIVAVAGGLGSAISKTDFGIQADYQFLERLSALAIALLPVIIVPLAFLFFDDELMIFESEIYILTRLKPRLSALMDPGALKLMRDSDLLAGTFAWRSRHLQVHFQADHATISRPRYTLFLSPVHFASLVLVLLSAFEFYKFRAGIQSGLLTGITTVCFVIGILADYICLRYLKAAISCAGTVRRMYCELVKQDQLGVSDFPETTSPTRAKYRIRFWTRSR